MVILKICGYIKTLKVVFETTTATSFLFTNVYDPSGEL